MKRLAKISFVLLMLLPACISQAVEETPNSFVEGTQVGSEAVTVSSPIVEEIETSPSFTDQLSDILNRCKSREMSLSPNGEHMVILCEEKKLWAFDIRTDTIEPAADIELPMFVFRFKWSKDSSALALSTREGVHFFSPAEKKLTGYLESKHWFPVDIAWSADNDSIAISVPGGSLFSPTEAFVKILSYPELEVLKEINYPGETPNGTFSILWNGELENSVFFLTAGKLKYLNESGIRNLDFPILAPDFLSYMGWLSNNRYYVTGIAFEPQAIEDKIGIFEGAEKIVEFTIKDPMDGSRYINILDIQASRNGRELIALLSNGNIVVYLVGNDNIGSVLELEKRSINSSSKICLLEAQNALVLMFGDGNFEIIPFDVNLLNGEL